MIFVTKGSCPLSHSMMTSESRTILAKLQTLRARAFAETANESMGAAEIFAIPPDTGNLPGQRRFVQSLLRTKLLPHALSHQFGYRLSLLAAYGRKDFSDVFVQVKLSTLHDEYYTS